LIPLLTKYAKPLASKRWRISALPLTETEMQRILDAANITTLARTAVERDYHGEVIKAHAPEMPTRFAKQLMQLLRGSVAVGMTRERGMELAIRCARDSIPPLRVEILLDVALHPATRPNDVRKRVQKPWNTIRRELQALHIIGLLSCLRAMVHWKKRNRMEKWKCE
jgi:hypothetical protein